jgi:hypothetical protein
MNPLVLKRGEVAADLIAKQKEIFTGQLREDPKPKPEASWPKIIEGKLNKWFSEVALLEHESVVVPKETIAALRDQAGKAAGGSIKIARFVRYERGEGIDKGDKGDFAAEVKMAGTHESPRAERDGCSALRGLGRSRQRRITTTTSTGSSAPVPTGRGARRYDVGLARMDAFARSHDLPHALRHREDVTASAGPPPPGGSEHAVENHSLASLRSARAGAG